MNATVYIVTVQREKPRDYQVCWCHTLEEAHEKRDSFLANCSPERKFRWYTIEEFSDGKRTTIEGLARA